ncbi:transcription elongation factor elongin B [Dermatophagoides farinae]|uniref:transcription elongation factor elongin B n=1 Tax=Dermatophagoides farinae TaxID=6954 RepID=UPI003F5E81FA
MEVFLMVRRQTTTIFLDCKEVTPIIELKKMIEGITKILAKDQMLIKDDQPMDDHKTVAEYNLTVTTAKAQAPATIGLCFRQPDGMFEPLEMTPYSQPPELPDELKPVDSREQND